MKPPALGQVKHRGKLAHQHQQVPHPDSSQKLLEPITGAFQPLRSKLRVPAISSAIHPGDDFYKACNDSWLKSTHLAAYRSTYSVSEELEEFLEDYLFKIANQATQKAKAGLRSTKPSAEDAAEDAIGRLVLSAMRPEKQKESVEYLKRGMRGLACIRDQEDVAVTLGRMIRSGVPTLLRISVDVVYMDGRREYCLSIAPGSLGLPDPRYYIEIHGAPGILKQYKDLLDFISKEFDLGFQLAEGISIETGMAEPLQKFQDIVDYKIHEFSDLRRKFSAIPWEKLFAEGALGIPAEILRKIRKVAVTAPEWISVVNSFFESMPVEQWAPLLGIHTAIHGIQYLPAPFDTRYFELFGKAILGQTQKTPQHILTMNVLKDLMAGPLSFFFIKRYLDPKEKTEATKFVESILVAAKRRILDTPWMETTSRKRAAKKIEAMAASVFYPETSREAAPTKLPALQTDLFLVNVYLLNGAAFDREFERLQGQHPEPAKKWDEPVFLVNAFYYQELNQIVLPAGYFFWPFYDSGRIGWSYGGLGAIISHEIVHAFDEEGKDIDEKGAQNPIWTKADSRAYQDRLAAIIRLFNQAKVGGVYVNGKLTASENLADLGGLGIALDALEHLLRAKKVGAEQRLRELREFFWSYAVSWRTKERDRKAIQDIYLDRHAPPEFRVNFIVSQFDAWYEAFNVHTEHDLYIPPEERIRIF